MIDNPLVSICMITYNHEKYIKQAVDSIVCQEMDFPYELLVADDASTDRTAQILYENYSHVEQIKLILREKNSEGRNMYLTLQEARGKYLYVCEGDDYWVGVDGLQTLLDWLEDHKEYVGVCGRRATLSEKSGFMSLTYDKATDHGIVNLQDFLDNKKCVDACAMLTRNFYHDGKYDYRSYLASSRVGDLTLMVYVLLHGDLFQLDKIVGVYRSDRIKGAGSYNEATPDKKKFEEHMELISNLPKLIPEKLDYAKRKEVYADWYIFSLPSTYEFIKNIPYLQRKIGIRRTLNCIRKWVKSVRT